MSNNIDSLGAFIPAFTLDLPPADLPISRRPDRPMIELGPKLEVPPYLPGKAPAGPRPEPVKEGPRPEPVKEGPRPVDGPRPQGRDAATDTVAPAAPKPVAIAEPPKPAAATVALPKPAPASSSSGVMTAAAAASFISGRSCGGCHKIDTQLVGPALKGMKKSERPPERLESSVRNGRGMMMPHSTDLISAADLKKILDYVKANQK